MIKFDNTDAKTCVEQAMAYIASIKKEYEELDYEFPVNITSCRWALEQAILNRVNLSMSEAVMRYIDKVDYEAKSYNGI